MAQVVGSLPCSWEARTEFLVPDFILVLRFYMSSSISQIKNKGRKML